jgi:uncharacterized tellurite resistance protein B-like protein
MGILDFLGQGRAAKDSRGDTDAVRKIAAALEALPPSRARYVASFAHLLSRVANADREISDDETREMERIVRSVAGLPEAQAVLVVHMAKARNVLFGGTDNFLVTREFNAIATRDQKTALLHCLFAVSAADRSISTLEDGTIRQIANELLLDHADYIAVKSAYREHLAALRKTPEPPSR